MSHTNELRNIPAIDKILNLDKIKSLIKVHGLELVTYISRQVIEDLRKAALNGKKIPSLLKIVNEINYKIHELKTKSLKPVINATGIIIHTNLGRSPLGKQVLEDSISNLLAYNNLEFDLNSGKRGSRHTHLAEILKFLTGAEDVLVVNNNAAAIMLILRSFAKGKEVITSRGELIEIGGSFRMPEIMEASDCIMKEVGTTNKTHLKDYENAINEETAALLKVHQSNYVIKGFTEKVSLADLVKLGKRKNLPVIYDMGSGLLRKISIPAFENEPDVKETLRTGVDILCFSGDKLLGGAQAGIIVGSKKYIEKLKKEPMTRALRIGKTTIALLETSCMNYLDENKLFSNNLVFHLASQSKEKLKNKAEKLSGALNKQNITSKIIDSKGQTGGGSLPGEEIDSYAVAIDFKEDSNKKSALLAEKLYFSLLKTSQPILGILRQGKIMFDVITLDEAQINTVASYIIEAYIKITK